MGARGKYGESKRYSEAVLEGNGQVAKGEEEEESEFEEGMRSEFLFFFLRRNILYLFLGCGSETGNPILFHSDGREALRRHVWFLFLISVLFLREVSGR
jgi:hypothetical protein